MTKSVIMGLLPKSVLCESNNTFYGLLKSGRYRISEVSLQLSNRSYMAITKEKKGHILTKLNEIKDSADSIVFVHYKNVSGQDTTAMRSELRTADVGYFVAKKTLIKRAFEGAFSGEMPAIEGEIAIAYSSDAIAPAQQMKTFSEKHKENLSIEGGVFQGVYKTKQEMIEIASIPPLQVLRGMFVNVINSPIQGLVIALNQVAEKKST